MKQVIQSPRSGKLALTEVPEPKVAAGQILVKTGASLISAGTERMTVDFASRSLAGKARARPDLVKKVLGKAKRDGIAATLRSVMARLDEPIPLGYSAAGRVLAVGAGLEGIFRAGERVAVAGAGIANHAEINLVPGALAAAIPGGVADDEACYGTLGSIALHSVRNLGCGLGDRVAVIGAGLVGQLAAQFLALSGARVAALDYDPARLDLALKNDANPGAEAVFDLSAPDAVESVMAWTGGRGCDGILIAAATASSEPFQTAGAIARDRARVCMVGLTGTEFPYRDFMKKELNLVVSRSYGPGRYDPDFEGRGVKYPEGWVRWTETENLAECLRLMDPALSPRLDVAALTTHRLPLERAEAAYEMVTGGTEPHLGVVLTYPDTPDAPADARQRPVFPTAKARVDKDRMVLGMIGAGGFARSVLLPELKRMNNVHLHTVVARRGAGARKSEEAFGFDASATDEDAVLQNPEINAVIIATRHDSHASLTARALAANKAVLVEKPLGLCREDINKVVEARNRSDAFFQVGFNRRHAPLCIAVRDHLAGRHGPRFILLRVNAGPIPADSWIHGAEGGGRILGEVCHFVDLARFFMGQPISSVQADATGTTASTPGGGQGKACDDVTVTLRFADGGLATIAYTSLGDGAMGKELFEAYGGGCAITLDNYRSLKTVENGSVSSRGGNGDKGVGKALRAFAGAVCSGGPAPVDEAELVETSIATVAVMESLRSGTRIDL